jgi:hypothetical protein
MGQLRIKQMGTKTSIYINDDIADKMPSPGVSEPSNSMARAVDRLSAILEPSCKRLEQYFTEGEWNTMRNACSSTSWERANSVRHGVLANIEDSLDIELESYGVDRKTLEDKLKALTVAEQFALVDSLERWWAKQ